MQQIVIAFVAASASAPNAASLLGGAWQNALKAKVGQQWFDKVIETGMELNKKAEEFKDSMDRVHGYSHNATDILQKYKEFSEKETYMQNLLERAKAHLPASNHDTTRHLRAVSWQEALKAKVEEARQARAEMLQKADEVKKNVKQLTPESSEAMLGKFVEKVSDQGGQIRTKADEAKAALTQKLLNTSRVQKLLEHAEQMKALNLTAAATNATTAPSSSRSRSLTGGGAASAAIAPGTYHGKAEKGYACLFGRCAMRVKVDATAFVHGDGTMSVDVTGSGRLPVPVHVKCLFEPYRLVKPAPPSGTTSARSANSQPLAAPIMLLNYPITAASTSDCIDRALPMGVSLKTLTYDATQQQIHMNIEPVGIHVQAKLQVSGSTPQRQSSGPRRSLHDGNAEQEQEPDEVGAMVFMRRHLRGSTTRAHY
jgi:hypothetical protein